MRVILAEGVSDVAVWEDENKRPNVFRLDSSIGWKISRASRPP